MSFELYGVVRDQNVRHLVGEFEAQIFICATGMKISCVDQAACRALARSELYNGGECEQQISFHAIRLITVQDGAITIYGVRRNITIQLFGNVTVQRYFESLLVSRNLGYIFECIGGNTIATMIGAEMFRRYRVAEIVAGNAEMRFFANRNFGSAVFVPRVSERIVTERAIGELVAQEVFSDVLRLIARIIRRFMLANRA